MICMDVCPCRSIISEQEGKPHPCASARRRQGEGKSSFHFICQCRQRLVHISINKDSWILTVYIITIGCGSGQHNFPFLFCGFNRSCNLAAFNLHPCISHSAVCWHFARCRLRDVTIILRRVHRKLGLSGLVHLRFRGDSRDLFIPAGQRRHGEKGQHHCHAKEQC